MYPHFLCIGAQKSGTTWLHFNLQHHPDIYLPPIKELHYFDKQQDSLSTRLLLKRVYYRVAARQIVTELVRFRYLRDANKFIWLSRYLLWPRSDSWYASLFPNNNATVCGEITPGYALLDDATLQQVARCNPKMKMIYLIRNPLERAWSGLYMKASKNQCPPLSSLTNNEMIKLLSQNSIYRHSDYLHNLDRWQQYFHEEQFFIGFFDQLRDEPATLLRNIHRFLGIASAEQHIPSTASQARNVRNSGKIPEAVIYPVLDIYYDQLVALHQRFNNRYTARWLQEAQTIEQSA